ncbi:ThuA domain-containing protein [Xylanimonas allomyrinae]|uniref:ThuA domain-containing protein n=1 Tax=Xylanimonas allomyrinae TaxID=2509459 RepID=A0A4P6EPC1_9MICO|nr:ThuA domain-containing protein [Xylanimonas allomyrinae]QAY64285.1 ThuA domain-containing protein [Xylanimonas allomyrinae]
MTDRARILVLAGRGRHEDPWHDHAATSHRLALVLAALGEVEVRSTFRDALDDVAGVDLLVLNVGAPTPGHPDDAPAWTPFHERLDAWARADGRILAVHQTALAFPDAPGFGEVLGGRWVEGVTGHPPIGGMRLTVAGGTHPITAGLGAVEAYDERYCRLRVAPSSQVLGWVHDDDEPHPALWVSTAHGGRTVYSALGHDARSYDSAGHQELLLRAARWLLR